MGAGVEGGTGADGALGVAVYVPDCVEWVEVGVLRAAEAANQQARRVQLDRRCRLDEYRCWSLERDRWRYAPPSPGTLVCSTATSTAIFGNPLFLVKARMQAYSPFNPVGAQHQYDSVLHAFRTIVKADGFKGLARGVDAAMLRTAMGSSAQLPAYNLAKTKLKDWGLNEGVSMYFLASTFSGACVCAVMQPAGAFTSCDIAGFERTAYALRARRYGLDEDVQPSTQLNRPRRQASRSTLSVSSTSAPTFADPDPLADKNPIDCLYKTWKVEGVRGWYKGTTAHLMRIAPHTVRPFSRVRGATGTDRVAGHYARRERVHQSQVFGMEGSRGRA